MADTRKQVEKLTKIDQMLIRTVAMHKIAGLGLRISTSDVEEDGRKVRKAMQTLVDLGKVVKGTGGYYEATEMLYEEIIPEAPADAWEDARRSVGTSLPYMSVYNLKWIAEHRSDYIVCFVKDPYHMLRGNYFEIVEPVEGVAWEQEKAYREFHHENPYGLDLVAVRRALLVEKKAAHRDARIRETMSYNLVDYLVDGGHVSEEERASVVRSSTRSGLPGLDAPRPGLGEDPDNWESDSKSVVEDCASKIAELTARMRLFERLASIDWGSLKVKLLRDCTKAVDEDKSDN